MQYKCCCSHGCTNMMDSLWFTEYFGICKECVYAGPEHIEELKKKHDRSSYVSKRATVAERYTQEA